MWGWWGEVANANICSEAVYVHIEAEIGKSVIHRVIPEVQIRKKKRANEREIKKENDREKESDREKERQ